MTRCNQCEAEIHGEWDRIDAGATVGGERVPRDVNLHSDCYGPWMLANYPWACHVRTREVSA